MVAAMEESIAGRPFAFEVSNVKDSEDSSKDTVGVTLAAMSFSDRDDWMGAFMRAAVAPVTIIDPSQDSKTTDNAEKAATDSEATGTKKYSMDDIDEEPYAKSSGIDEEPYRPSGDVDGVNRSSPPPPPPEPPVPPLSQALREHSPPLPDVNKEKSGATSRVESSSTNHAQQQATTRDRGQSHTDPVKAEGVRPYISPVHTPKGVPTSPEWWEPNVRDPNNGNFGTFSYNMYEQSLLSRNK
jgi:hypothetical protein